MKSKRLAFKHPFQVVLGNKRAQFAEMVLPAGETVGGPDNRHRGSDQWLFVVSGTGRATINGKRCPLRAGTLVLIKKRQRHEIVNTGRAPLKTLNVYVPPAYTRTGKALPRAKAR
jgi:mannose-6-phosphate isomerase-like protein (cupin superfamily)